MKKSNKNTAKVKAIKLSPKRATAKKSSIASSSEQKYYVAFRQDADLYYAVLAGNKHQFDSWSRQPDEATPMALDEAERVVREGKQERSLGEDWFTGPFELLYKNALQDLSNTIFDGNQRGPFDIIAMKDRISQFVIRNYRLGKLQKKMTHFKDAFQDLILNDEDVVLDNED